MKIVTGKYKNQNIQSISGNDIRPSTARVREAVFNILMHNKKFYDGERPKLLGCKFADICCGSGSISLSALSHGADQVCLVDNNSKSLKIAKANLKLLEQQCKFILCDATDLPTHTHLAFDIIFIDPPYYDNNIPAILYELNNKTWSNHNSIIIIELSSKDHKAHDTLLQLNDYTIILEKKYGKSKVLFMRQT